MKKTIMIAALASLSLFTHITAATIEKTEKKVVIDLTTLKKDSKPGKDFEKQREKIYKDVQDFDTKKRKEITDAQQNISLEFQQGKITQAMAQQKIAELTRLQRRAELDVQEKREEAIAKVQELEQKLEEKLIALIPDLATKKGWTDVREARTGGTLFVATTLDKTPDALKAINESFEKETLKAQITTKKA